MSTYAYKISDQDGCIYFESSDTDSNLDNGLNRTRGSNTGVLEENAKSIDSIFNGLSPVISNLRHSLSEINNPSEVLIEFGVKIGGKAGIIFSSIDSEANFKISITWRN